MVVEGKRGVILMDLIDRIIIWGSAIGALLTILRACAQVKAYVVEVESNKSLLKELPGLLKQIKEINTKLQDIKTQNQNQDNSIQQISNTLKTQETSIKNEKELVLSVARQMLLEEMEKAIYAGEVTIERKLVLGDLYHQYEANGGNGTIKEMWENEYSSLKTI
jgi:cytochrome c biogenesis factor